MAAGLTTSSPSPDIVLTSLMNPVGSFGTSVSILLAASSSRCFLLFLPTQKNFDGSGIGGKNFNPATERSSLARSAAPPSCVSTKVARRISLSSRQLHVVVFHELAPFGHVGVDIASELFGRLRLG